MRVCEAIANPVVRADQGQSLGRLYLSAQVRNVSAQRLPVSLVCGTPDFAQQRTVGE